VLGGLRDRRARVTRRGIQIALGLLWVLDGALQLQPFMFTSRFAQEVIAPAGLGQPAFVARPVNGLAQLVAAQPAAATVVLAAGQVLLGVGLLVRGFERRALTASIGWGLGVWYVGEGLGGLASGDASLLTGAPGAALLYVVLAAVAWPHPEAYDRAPRGAIAAAWAGLWVGAAVLQLLPGQATGRAVAGAVAAGSDSPGWLGDVAGAAGAWAAHHGRLTVAALSLVELLIGLGGLASRTRRAAAAAGLLLALGVWIVGQHLGQLYTGQATDPNTGPVLALMAIALAAAPPWRRRDAHPGARVDTREPGGLGRLVRPIGGSPRAAGLGD
jgi:hypothetical protein